MKQTAILLALLLCMSVTACSKDDTKKNAEQTVKPPVAVEVAAAATSGLTDGIQVTGSLEPKFSVDIKTQIPGLIQQVYVTEWVRVRKGQALARIDVAEIEALVRRAEAEVESAKANLAQAGVAATRAERERERMLKLKESGLATQQAVDDARSEAEAARTRVDAARAQLGVAGSDVRQATARLAKSHVVSPMDGVVALRDVNVGDLASDAAAGKPIFRIVDNRLLNLTVTVSSADSGRVRVGQQIDFSVDALPGRIFKGKVMFINPELNAADRSLKVIAEVQNVPEILKGGLFTKGHIITGTRSDVLQIPRSAIDHFDLAARTGSLFVIENGSARRREVTTGSVSGEQVEIVAGLKQGEQYVVRGGFNLKDGDRVALTPVNSQKEPKGSKP
ncbi:MAG: efflux RND transporter periplasmic adaptor subunit [Desulfuromonadaceae bacterium]|nr:efflux RND transporter periplasmic adaptor subunit [Desulfuromonadaceae bacterium]